MCSIAVNNFYYCINCQHLIYVYLNIMWSPSVTSVLHSFSQLCKFTASQYQFLLQMPVRSQRLHLQFQSVPPLHKQSRYCCVQQGVLGIQLQMNTGSVKMLLFYCLQTVVFQHSYLNILSFETLEPRILLPGNLVTIAINLVLSVN